MKVIRSELKSTMHCWTKEKEVLGWGSDHYMENSFNFYYISHSFKIMPLSFSNIFKKDKILTSPWNY